MWRKNLEMKSEGMKELLEEPKFLASKPLYQFFGPSVFSEKNFRALQPVGGMKKIKARNLMERLNLGISNLSVVNNKSKGEERYEKKDCQFS